MNENIKFDDKQYHLSVTAGMNQRYHQARAHWWICWDRGCKILVGILAVAGAVLAFAPLFHAGLAFDIVGVVVACLAAVFAVILNVIPYAEWAGLHRELFQKWSDLREEIDSLLFEVNGEPTGKNFERLRQLDAKVHRICAAEPGGIKSLIDTCYAEEVRSRQPDKSMACAA